MNWTADPWFSSHHAEKLTDDFKAWWIDYYGVPSNYSDDEDEQREYWIRCAFALSGWLAARNAEHHARPERSERT